MVAAALTEELALLSDGARRVLEGAAVAGDPFEPELAAAAAAVSETSAVEALDELLALDLVRHTDVPRRFRFRHPLVRRAVYEAAPRGWRLGAHERSAEALAARGASAPARAHHVERCARQGDVAAVAVLREAGEQVAPRAPATAARWFEGALRLLPPTAPAAERVELLVARAGALTPAGHLAESQRALLDALALVPEDSYALRARLTRTCAGLENALGRYEQAHGRLANALDGLPDHGSPEAVALMIELGVNGFWRSRYEAMQESCQRAVSAARVVGDAPLTAAALALLALADSTMGAGARAESGISEAAALVASLSDDELAHRLDAATWLAGAELYLDRYAEADAHAARALAVGRATGQGELFLVLRPDAGPGLVRARQAGRGRRPARPWGRGGTPAGQHAGAGVEPLQPLSRGARGRGRGHRARHRSGERRPQPRSGRGLPLGVGCREARRGPFRNGSTGTRCRIASRLRRGRGARAHRRQLEGLLPRAANALLARARPRRRRRTRGRLRGGLGHGRAAPAGRRLGGSRRGGRRSARRRPDPRCRARRSRRRLPQTRSAPLSRPHCHERSPAEHSPKPASATAPQRN